MGLAVLLSASLIALMYFQSRLGATQTADLALRQQLDRVAARFEQLLLAAEMTAGSGLDLTRDRAVAAGELEGLLTRTVAAFQQRPELTVLGFTLAASGAQARVERHADGALWLVESGPGPDGARVRRERRWSGGVFVAAGGPVADEVDPRAQPFFQRAVETGRAGWAPRREDPKRVASGARPGVAFALPSKGADGALAGVWHAELDARALNDFARDLRTETGANAIVLEETAAGQRLVVAHPDAAGAADAAAALRADEVGSAALAALGGSFSSLRGDERSPRVTTAGPLQLRQAYRLLDAARFPRWLILVAEPARAGDPDFRQTQLVLLGGAAVLTLGAVWVALWLARRLAQPVEKLRAAVETTAAEGDARLVGAIDGPRELVQLAAAFDRMVESVGARRRELQAANSQLTTLLDNVPGVVWALDRDGRYILQNRLSRTLHGDCLGRRLEDFKLPEGVRAALEDGHRRAFAGETVAAEVVVPGSLGERHWQQVVAPLRLAAGDTVIGVVGLSFDQTEQRAVEQALRASEERVRLHLGNTPLAVIDWSPKYRIRSWNHAAEHIFGWTAQEALGQSARMLVPPHEFAEVEKIGAEVPRMRGSFRNYLQSLTKDGRLVDCEWYNTVLRDERDRFLGVSSLVLDVTQRMEAERAFHEADERFRAAFQKSPLPIALLRLRDRMILDVNERWVAVYQQARDAVVGRSGDDLNLWESPEEGRDFVRELVSGRDIRDREVRLKDVHGVVYTMALSAARIELAGETCAIYAAIDITDRKETENELMRVNFTLERRVAERTAELANTNARLRDLDRLKSEFLATMSHELRTPLNSILGFTDLLRDGVPGPVNPEQAKQLGLVFDSAQHLLALINDLLDLSRIEAGRMELVVESVSPAEVLREVESTLAPLVAKKPVRYLTALAPGAEAVRLRTDRKRVFQVLLNLAHNAVKFTEHGEVTLTCQPRPDGSVTVAVRDSGIGIRPEQVGRLFEAFRQLDGSRRRAFEGTGLGLHLVKKLLGLLGGDVTVESEAGRGTCFTVRLPPAPPPDAPVVSSS